MKGTLEFLSHVLPPMLVSLGVGVQIIAYQSASTFWGGLALLILSMFLYQGAIAMVIHLSRKDG